MAARASAAPSEDAATSSSHWVVRNLGRPPAVESSSASSKPDFARKYLGTQEKAPNRLAGLVSSPLQAAAKVFRLGRRGAMEPLR